MRRIIYDKFNEGFEVLVVVGVKRAKFGDIRTWSPLEINRVSEEHFASIFRIE